MLCVAAVCGFLNGIIFLSPDLGEKKLFIDVNSQSKERTPKETCRWWSDLVGSNIIQKV